MTEPFSLLCPLHIHMEHPLHLTIRYFLSLSDWAHLFNVVNSMHTLANRAALRILNLLAPSGRSDCAGSANSLPLLLIMGFIERICGRLHSLIFDVFRQKQIEDQGKESRDRKTRL